MSNAAKVRFEALALTEDERVGLCHALLESLSVEPDQAWLEAWGAEISQRMVTFDEHTAIPGDQVLAKMRATLVR